MKKITVMLLLLMAVTPLLGQTFKERVNFSIFGGVWSKQTNINNNGKNIGVYLDYLPYKSQNGWTVGFFAVGNYSNFKDNLTKYEADVKEYGLGGTFGYYDDAFSKSNQLFLGFSFGWKHIDDKGISQNRWGRYEGIDKVELATANINFNLLKRSNIFPRTQILLTFQIPFTSVKEAHWNNETVKSESWNRTYIEVLAKESIVNLGLNTKLYLSPKIIGGYAYSKGDNKNVYMIGGEVALHKQYKDDFLSVYCLYKVSGQRDDNTFVFGLNMNLISLIF